MRPGEVQWMRAGRGVVHDESPDEQLRRCERQIARPKVERWLMEAAGD